MRMYNTITKKELACLYNQKINFTGNNGFVLEKTLKEKLTVAL